MNVVVFGATGKVGRLVVAEALRRGHRVTAFAHKTKPADKPDLTVVLGDIKSRADVETAVQGADAVISALGSWGTPSKDILSSAMANIIPAMEARGISRLIGLTGNVAKTPHEKLPFMTRMARRFLGIVAPKILLDSERHITLLDDSTLDWTVVRASVMSPSKRTTYQLTASPRLISIVPRAAIASSLVDLAETDSWTRQAPGIV